MTMDSEHSTVFLSRGGLGSPHIAIKAVFVVHVCWKNGKKKREGDGKNISEKSKFKVQFLQGIGHAILNRM